MNARDPEPLDRGRIGPAWWLSLIVLAGLGTNGAFGWWWADPVAALGAAVFIAREGLEAWRGEDDCCAA